MKRLTTDTPDGNLENMLNFVYSKDSRAHIRCDGVNLDVPLTEWAKKQCILYGCDDFPEMSDEEIDRVLCGCMMDYPQCPVAIAYCFASQAVHLRDRLKLYEDTGLWPEDITKPAVGCVFYCNRQCNLDGDFCAEGPSCPYEMDAGSARRILVCPDNAPLTIEELREMDGEPVWRVRTDGTRAEWAIICASDDMCKNSIGETAMFSTYGERWLAYRRKPEGAQCDCL